MTITPDNFFRIEGWMRTELNLKGNELMAYALIYSFQTAYDKPFDGSQAYIAEWLGISRESVNKTLLRLREKECLTIGKIDKGYIHKNSYSCKKVPQIISNSNVKKVHTRMLKKFTLDSEESSQRSVKKVNNIETDIETNLLNRLLKERGDATEFAPSLASSNSVENPEPKAKPKAKAKQKRFKKPTADEIRDYCKTKDIDIDVDYFLDYYESNGWMTGKTHMKDWQASVRNWARREKQFNKTKSNNWKGTNYGSSSNTSSIQDDYVSEYDYEPDEIIYT
jgi:predicted transcriptional regulator